MPYSAYIVRKKKKAHDIYHTSSYMLQFGRDYQPHPCGWDPAKEEEWRRLLRDSMRDLNSSAFIADCKIGDNTPDQPPHDYYAFDQDDPDLVFARAYAV
jgi:hypothetical protein